MLKYLNLISEPYKVHFSLEMRTKCIPTLRKNLPDGSLCFSRPHLKCFLCLDQYSLSQIVSISMIYIFLENNGSLTLLENLRTKLKSSCHVMAFSIPLKGFCLGYIRIFCLVRGLDLDKKYASSLINMCCFVGIKRVG